MIEHRTFSHQQAARFYDRLGSVLDTQAIYESRALRELTGHLKLDSAQAVLEFGCGTGRLAAELLQSKLSPDATYLGIDVSRAMVGLARRRLQRWASRVEVRQSDGVPRIAAPDGAFDRFICTYVLDLLSTDDIRMVLIEAHRVLKPDGLLGLVSLTGGPTTASRIVTAIWSGLHRVSPWLVGGCRPISLSAFLMNREWHIEYATIAVSFGVPSEIIVARRVRATWAGT